MIKINDKSKDGIYSSNMELVNNFTDYSSKNLDFDKPVEIEFLDDEKNAKNPLGTTAHYNPEEMKITIYVTGRHLKDILRSISHELIHHVQNCRGDLEGNDTELGYAQKDKHMRGMEHEAYTMGNIMNFRDFEDNYKRGIKMSGVKKLQEQRNKKINSLLMGVEEPEILEEGFFDDLKSMYQKAVKAGDEATKSAISVIAKNVRNARTGVGDAVEKVSTAAKELFGSDEEAEAKLKQAGIDVANTGAFPKIGAALGGTAGAIGGFGLAGPVGAAAAGAGGALGASIAGKIAGELFSAGKVQLPKKEAVYIILRGNPKAVAQYLFSQVDSTYVNDDEFKLLALGLHSAAKRGLMGRVQAAYDAIRVKNDKEKQSIRDAVDSLNRIGRNEDFMKMALAAAASKGVARATGGAGAGPGRRAAGSKQVKVLQRLLIKVLRILHEKSEYRENPLATKKNPSGIDGIYGDRTKDAVKDLRGHVKKVDVLSDPDMKKVFDAAESAGMKQANVKGVPQYIEVAKAMLKYLKEKKEFDELGRDKPEKKPEEAPAADDKATGGAGKGPEKAGEVEPEQEELSGIAARAAKLIDSYDPDMTRIQALRAARQNIMPNVRTRRRGRGRYAGMATYLIKGLIRLMDDGVAPGIAYEAMLALFGENGKKYASPKYEGSALFTKKNIVDISNRFQRRYEELFDDEMKNLP
jgi:hypothetical protein